MPFSLGMKCNPKSIKNIALCVVYLLTWSVGAQDTNESQPPQEEQLIQVLKGDGFLTWVDNSPGAYVTLNFPGSTLTATQIELSFNIDTTYFYQVLRHDYSSEQYTNSSDTIKEEQLLKYYQKYEQDYLEDEVFNSKLTVTDEFFYNTDGKKFHLYYFPMPESFIAPRKEGSNYPSHHCYLNFIANQKVYGIYTVIMESEGFYERMAVIKEIAESADIYGYKVDLDALSYKLSLAQEEHTGGMELVNPVGKYVIDIPDWFNVIESPSDNIFIGTFPDNNNVKNAVSITYFPKDQYDSLDDFNTKEVTGYKTLDKIGSGTMLLRDELTPPENATGIAYKMQIMNQGRMFEMQYVTYESSEAYILVNFTATPETYDKNAIRFRTFLKGLIME